MLILIRCIYVFVTIGKFIIIMPNVVFFCFVFLLNLLFTMQSSSEDIVTYQRQDNYNICYNVIISIIYTSRIYSIFP